MKEIYLDNSATTRVDPEVQQLVLDMMDRNYGNPSSLHRKGLEAEKAVREARERIAATLKTEPKNIIFTSGGTESNNNALFGVAYASRRMGKHIITTEIEHASIASPAAVLEELGYEVTRLPVDRRGVVQIDTLKEALRPDTILVSVMAVNNEIGTVEPLEQIARIVHENNPKTVFHVDAVQAYGKIRLRPKKTGIDLLSVSSHKFHGPKGAGFLYCADGVRMHPIILGGGQQMDRRSGTDNVPGVCGMALAAKKADERLEENLAHVNHLHEMFCEGVHRIEGLSVNGWDETADPEAGRPGSPEREAFLSRRVPHIVSVSAEGVRAEVLLHALEEKGIYVSAGSACSSNHPSVSRTLRAIGVPKNLLDSTVRFSFCDWTTEEEIEETLAALKEILPTLRMFVRK
jgi:cysteine desulfurase